MITTQAQLRRTRRPPVALVAQPGTRCPLGTSDRPLAQIPAKVARGTGRMHTLWFHQAGGGVTEVLVQ